MNNKGVEKMEGKIKVELNLVERDGMKVSFGTEKELCEYMDVELIKHQISDFLENLKLKYADLED